MDETERVEIMDNRTHKSAEDLTWGGGVMLAVSCFPQIG